VFISIRQYLQISEKTNEVAMICDNWLLKSNLNT
jgi:hypothetical protein